MHIRLQYSLLGKLYSNIFIDMLIHTGNLTKLAPSPPIQQRDESWLFFWILDFWGNFFCEGFFVFNFFFFVFLFFFVVASC